MSLPVSLFDNAKIIDSGIWAKLSPSARALYPVVLMFINLQTNSGWPGAVILMKLSGIKKYHTIGKAQGELVEVGLIDKTWLAPPKPGAGYRRKRHFHIKLPRIPKRHMPDSLNGHMGVSDAGKRHAAITYAGKGQIERRERIERDQSVKRPITEDFPFQGDGKRTGNVPENLLLSLRAKSLSE